jgi:hypothetical protein
VVQNPLTEFAKLLGLCKTAQEGAIEDEDENEDEDEVHGEGEETVQSTTTYENPDAPPLQRRVGLQCSGRMLKKLLPLMSLALLAAGCTSTFTNLTPQTQARNANNLYPVEVAMDTRQATLRWDTIRPQIMVGTEFYTMRPTLLMTNRWEGFVPVAAGTNITHYRYKFDFNYNTFGTLKSDSALSPEYTLRIVETNSAVR